MSLITEITRRQFVAGSAALTTAGLTTSSAMAKAPLQDAGGGIFARVKVGSFDVTTLLDGQRTVDNIQSIFGTNVSKEEFAKVSAENLIPADKSRFFFTPTVVNTAP